MAGLLAANMLRKMDPVVWEAQPFLPDNHGALLRFRSDAVAQATGQSFRKVRVLKGIKEDFGIHCSPSLFDNNRYSQKVTGEVMDRSVLNMEPSDRFIAPDDFLTEMARGITVRYGCEVGQGDVQPRDQSQPSADSRGPIPADIPVLSTIPMPIMMKLVGWEEVPGFPWRAVWSLRCNIESPRTDVYQTIYYPGTESHYRASITGRRLIVEFMEDPGNQFPGSWEGYAASILHDDFGIKAATPSNIVIKRQKYGKLAPIDDRLRRRFILHLTERYNIYSVGRFACWRQILLDDVVQDISLIHDWIVQKDGGYSRSMHYKER